MTSLTENTYWALGGSNPGVAGFVCDGNGYDLGADITGQHPGIKGTATGLVTGEFAGYGDGVQGHGAGGFSGVAGFGDPNFKNPATGFSGIGVFGQGGGGNVGGSGDGVQGHGVGGFSGVAGFGDPDNPGIGVYAQGGGNGGPAIVAQSTAVHIRMNPVNLGEVSPNNYNNGNGIPGLQGDLLAVFNVPLLGLPAQNTSLWFNVTGGPKGWAMLQATNLGI
jgi:hypothetical protein